MKTFSRTSLPTMIVYNKKEYKLNVAASHIYTEANKVPSEPAILVKVLSKALRRKLDLHHRPYQPTEWIFTRNS
jgi:hypothetical protein